MIDILLNFAQHAGKVMMEMQQKARSLGNKDAFIGSIVTEADIKVSDMFMQTIADNFADLNYMIIDEEKITQYGNNIFAKVADTEYQFVIDPIDGTIQYAHGHPLYGLTIGVYKNAKPIIGLIYMPSMRELLYYDGQQCFYVENAFTPEAHKIEIKPHQKITSPIIFGHFWRWQVTEKFSISNTLFLNYFSAVSQTMYTLIGKAKAYAMYLHLWDIAGAVPIAQYLGFKIFEYGTGRVYDAISEEYFTTGMDTKNSCILCYPEDFAEISTMLTPKDGI
ncbi:MAG: hypothetical protein J6Y91_04410 [Alphaproteobacteria bacterium]|nr:hypothetical protein [Alphaproteobacteria bacterium]